MKKTTSFLCCIVIIIAACNKKSVPIITSRETPQPVITTTKTETLVKADITQGKQIFINRCGKCHDLPLPEQFTEKRWEGILSYMIPRARLTDEQGIHVTAYLKVNAAKQN